MRAREPSTADHATSVSTDSAPVQASSGGGLHDQLRSADYAQGQALLAPVQLTPNGGAKAPKDPKLLTDFEADFSAAAALIRKSTEAMTLVREAAKAGVEYGGHSEKGPVKDTWPYTAGNKVYIPKARTDAVLAMSDFVFELNNGVRKPEFDKLRKGAAKGSKTDVAAAKKYARDIITLEVEGMLRSGKVWTEAKKALGGGKNLDKYDDDFFREEWADFHAKRKTKAEIVTEVLTWTYTTGVDAGKTHEQYYVEQYKGIAK